MSIIQGNFYSKTLGNFVDVTVYLPSIHNGEALFYPLEEIHKKQQYRVVYLLHGMLDDHSSWIRWSLAEEIAEKHKLALVMPSGQNSFYVNMVHGLAYSDFICRELPMWAEANFPVLSDRENRFIAGLSMGGYGALRNGLAHPENYAAVGAFSAAADIIGLKTALQENQMTDLVDYDNIFGGYDKIAGTDNDLWHLMKTCKASGQPLPKILMGCGTEDPIVYTDQKRYADALKEEGFDIQYIEMSGDHEWSVWTACFRAFAEMISR